LGLQTQLPGLFILEDEKGRGVYTTKKIPKDSTIELCPVILLSRKDTELIHKTSLHDFYFIWELAEQNAAIALGYGSLYNHSDQPNADFEINLDTNEIKFIATEEISAGEEILINYISSAVKGVALWFDPK